MGNTARHTILHTCTQDHPHIHGEYREPLSSLDHQTGSPPHTWGTHHLPLFRVVKSRITPIYMGNTRLPFRRHGCKRDHPHIHGEHFLQYFNNFLVLGSPPYTWGTLCSWLWQAAQIGITPIYMGNTDGVVDIDVKLEDHPHIHGEHYFILRYGLGHGRITPIYMGNTCTSCLLCE